MRKILVLVAMVGSLSLTGCGSSTPEAIDATSAWVRFTGPTGAAYARIDNPTDDADALIGAELPSTVAGGITLHMTETVAEMSSMKTEPKIDLPADFTLEMKPGAFHFMIDDIRAAPAVGTTVPMTLRFERRSPITVDAEVRR